MTNPTMGLMEWLLLVVLSVLWGSAFFFVGVIGTTMSPFTVVLGRCGFAALALLAYVTLRNGRMPTSLRLWGAFLVMGALTSLIPHSLIVWGQRSIASGLAAILVSTTPLFSVILTHFLTDEERLTPGRLAGVLLGLSGVVVLIGPAALQGLGQHGLAQVAVLGAALAYACSGIYGRRFKALSPVVAAAGQISGTTVLVMPLALAVEQPWTVHPTLVTWAALLGLALLSTAFAALLFFHILAVAGTTNVMLVNFLVPISAVFLGRLILGERLEWTGFAGMALIFVGLAAIDGRLLSVALGRRAADDAARRKGVSTA